MFNPEEVEGFDAYEPNDPKHPAYFDRVADAAEDRERPPLSPLGKILLDLARSDVETIVAIQQAEKNWGR